DVHVAIDGNFTHTRYSSVDDNPTIILLSELSLWLTEAELESAKKHMAECKEGNGRGGRQQAHVPEGSLDHCEDVHKVVRDHGNETAKGVMALKGLMAMVCHYNVPLFICDITTPGEQCFYLIALIHKLASLLLLTATIGLLYNISCLLDRSIAKHNLIPEIAPHLSLATTTFHAY
ncbi:hypothetical protein M422DRAFT_85997, partial [Sphaerobolus stellatus SS14]